MHAAQDRTSIGHDAAGHGLPPPLAIGVLAGLLDQADRTMERDLAAARRLLARASALLRPAVPPPPASGRLGRLAPWQERRVRAHVDANLHASLRVEDLAAVARLSTSYFARAFKASFGEPPHAYLLRRRVERAQLLMRQGPAPLAQVALACGLSDQAHLSRVFRQVTGSSPSDWRRRHAGAP